MAHGWDVHRSFSAKRMDTGRESPQYLQKICQRFVTRKLSFGKSRATHPGPPKATLSFGGWLRGLPVASRIEQCSGATEHPQISGVKGPSSLHPQGRFLSTNMAPPRWPRVVFFSLKIPSSAGRQDSRFLG